ncbi:MAG: glycosyl hydrolase [Armatimonadota bacterium]
MHRYATASLALWLLPAPCASSDPLVLGSHWGNLEGQWLFRTDPHEVGERQGWAAADYDDSDWQTLRVPGHWEPQGVTQPRPGQPPRPKNGLPWTDYDGVAWYRLRFVLPEGWAGQALVLNLGSIDDWDRTYLNGQLVGETGPGVPTSVLVKRLYAIPADAAVPGAENVIAVRVEDGGGPGGFVGPLVSLLPASALNEPVSLPQGDRPLKQRFGDPPADSRILKIIHGWPDQPDAQDTLIRSLSSQGFGGVVCNVSFTDYLTSDAMWDAFVRAVNEAKKAGMSLWLYDEKGYPSGAAGGLVLRDHPEWEARGLLIAEAHTDGDPVSLDLPPGDPFMAVAFPTNDGRIALAEGIDLTNRVRDAHLTWDPPAGTWAILAITEDRLYENTHAAMSLADKLPYINLLMPEPTRRFIELTHQQYADRLGDDLGRYFEATFTDEPSLMSLFMRPMPYRVLPWAPNLPVEFRKRRGYRLKPNVPALILDAGARSAQVRHDFWLTVAELVSDSFFGQIQEFCREHNVLSGGHLLWEESLRNHVAFYGDFFRCLRRTDAPSIDCLTSVPAQVPWRIARLTGSAADLDGKPITMCETSDFSQRYRPDGDDRPVHNVTEDEIRGTCNRLMLSGITTITSYYSFVGLDTRQLRRLNEYVGRCSTMLEGGHQVADIAVVYPIESLWPRFTPARHGATDSPSALQVEEAFNAVSESLFAARRDFTYLDSRTLVEAQVGDGQLVHGDMRWHVVILPCVDTLPEAAWLNLAQFEKAGGVVIAVGARPTNSTRAFPSPRIVELGQKMLGASAEPRVTWYGEGAGLFLPQSAVAVLPSILSTIIAEDVAVSPSNVPVRVTHRRIEGRDVYFLINDGAQPVEVTVSLTAAGTGEQWDPATGEITPLESRQDIALALGPYEGMLFRFSEARERQRHRPPAAALPGIMVESLPEVQPVIGHGEFVQGSLERGGETAWMTRGTLTKSDVDTFLFVGFEYPGTIDLTGAETLVLDTSVPAGQRTPSQVLVILHEQGGANYLASTGRSLAAPGEVQSFVPISRFLLAGWSEDDNGRLDLDKVVRISVGWGGYFGTEGETIQFGLSLPRVARRQAD